MIHARYMNKVTHQAVVPAEIPWICLESLKEENSPPNQNKYFRKKIHLLFYLYKVQNAMGSTANQTHYNEFYDVSLGLGEYFF